MAFKAALRAKFNTIENSTSLLGLITICFVAAAVRHHPPVHELLAGALPTLTAHDPAKYWFIAVSIVGRSATDAKSGRFRRGSWGRG